MIRMLRLALQEKLLGDLWRACRAQIAAAPPGCGGVVLLGDSITHLGKWDLLFPDAAIRNLGIAGERTAHLLERIDAVVALEPEKLFLLIGTNDLGYGFAIEESAANVERLVLWLRERLPACTLHLQGVMPRQRKFAERVRALNDRYRAIAARHGVHFIDLYPVFDDGTGQIRADWSPDLLHLNGAGYLAWRDVLAPLLKA